ncbi:LysR family transcriptional regulator [Bradyrhizobium sp. NP1]|uniref:LysR family transcriptional regulator n=1 Tax=Bradyrhizobium sp. NP1 TaxID=3049772 RepID=UPI0025A58950|nr:LysR family transcriptional regulator [Bradyrhizobium sp. NP1]WJR79787.1 LysR family transcriptional regulator [Bradyrhizobium sp. NP1]
MDKIAGISVFVQVVDSGSYVAAGRALGQTASSVGKTIVRLEERLGVRLFHRNTRSISLTTEGARFLERCRAIMNEIAAAEADLAAAREGPHGRLRVSVPMVSDAWNAVFVEFMARFPEIELELSYSNRNVDLIEEGFEAALRIGNLEDSRLRSRKIGSFRLVLVASPSYLSRRPPPGCLGDLEHHLCLRTQNSSTGKLYPWPLGQDFVRRSERLVKRLVADHNAMLLAACLQGQGIACMPEFWARRHINSGELVMMLEAETDNRRIVSALWPMGPSSPKTSAFVDFIADKLPAIMQPSNYATTIPAS